MSKEFFCPENIKFLLKIETFRRQFYSKFTEKFGKDRNYDQKRKTFSQKSIFFGKQNLPAFLISNSGDNCHYSNNNKRIDASHSSHILFSLDFQKKIIFPQKNTS